MVYKSMVIAVRDMERSKKFYQGLFGQKIVLDFGANVVFEGGFSIQERFDQLAGIPQDQIQWGSNNMELYFETENFDEAVKRLKAYPDIKYVHAPKTHAWAQRVVRIYDPDGHIIEIGENMDTVIRRHLAEGYSVEETAGITQHPMEWVSRVKREMEGSDGDGY